ncbi:MAG: Cof-type HAD-IIB family hydrolase [Clostridia bacterium]|nr:Cof-type HAD-IIB family hydrolase [Clostridia bacterium]
MKKINYRLIVSDFDGTLIDDNQHISDKVRKAIYEYVSLGGVFAVCTGRMLKSILPQVRELGLKGLVIANQGTVIADIESGELIKYSGIKYSDAIEICRVLEDLGQPINVYSGDNLYTDIPKDNKYLQIYERITGVDGISVKGKISDFVEEKQLFCQKVACLVAESERDKLYMQLKEKLGGKFDVTCSARVLVEISALGETKGEAVKYLCNRLNIPVEKCVACGDNLNDLSMIRVAGVGVAVGNADIAVKAEADFVSTSNNEDAIAQIIEKYGFA